MATIWDKNFGPGRDWLLSEVIFYHFGSHRVVIFLENQVALRKPFVDRLYCTSVLKRPFKQDNSYSTSNKCN